MDPSLLVQGDNFFQKANVSLDAMSPPTAITFEKLLELASILLFLLYHSNNMTMLY